MSPMVAGESMTGKDGSLMSLVPHRLQDLKLLEDCKCCISQHPQSDAENNYREAKVLVSFLVKPHQKILIKQKESQLSGSTKTKNSK